MDITLHTTQIEGTARELLDWTEPARLKQQAAEQGVSIVDLIHRELPRLGTARVELLAAIPAVSLIGWRLQNGGKDRGALNSEEERLRGLLGMIETRRLLLRGLVDCVKAAGLTVT